MQDKPLRRNLYQVVSASCLFCVIVFLGTVTHAADRSNNILCRPELAVKHREVLAKKLRVITGWEKLGFDEHGALRFDAGGEAIGGSLLSRELLTAAMTGSGLLVIEDASNRSDVVFARVEEGRWTKDSAQKPPVHLILLDFADFSHIVGGNEVRASFNEGWAVLHEIAHVVHGYVDDVREDEIGECESLINRMRLEIGLPVRAEYYFTYFPGQEQSSFTTRFVRLAFDTQPPDKKRKKRTWIMWDGAVVGGLESPKQVAVK